MDFTSRLQLKKPLIGEDALVSDLNENFDKLDAQAAGPKICTSVTRPGTPYQGQQILETDTNNFLYWNGTRWASISGPSTGSGPIGGGSLSTAWTDIPSGPDLLIKNTGEYSILARVEWDISVPAGASILLSANFWLDGVPWEPSESQVVTASGGGTLTRGWLMSFTRVAPITALPAGSHMKLRVRTSGISGSQNVASGHIGARWVN